VLVVQSGIEHYHPAWSLDYENWQEPTKTPIWVSLKHSDKCNRMNQQETQKSKTKICSVSGSVLRQISAVAPELVDYRDTDRIRK
jgi:hypothetical protein